ncbi:hypothetical protein CARUB_v10016377mg, partial [Capsella rubella]
MMLPGLPQDLVEEILSRVPATNLSRLRYICKRWDALLKDKIFAEKHVRNASKQSRLLMLKDYRVCPMSVVNLHKQVDAPVSIEFKDGFELKDSLSKPDQVDVSEIFHCEGLLLCTTTNDNSLVAWNPCTGQTRWIRHSSLYKRNSKFYLGYGNKDKSCGRSYKILRYWDDGTLGTQVVEFEMYDFSSDSWRVLDDITCNCIPQLNGMSIKGTTYSYGLDKKNHNYTFLLSFDFTTEVFESLCFPLVVGFLSHTTIALSVVREEQLSLLLQRTNESKVDVWVTDEIDTKAVLWSKLFTVDIEDTRRYMISTKVSFLLDKEKKIAVVSEPRCRGEINDFVYIVGEDRDSITIYLEPTRELLRGGFFRFCTPFVFNYVPCL